MRVAYLLVASLALFVLAAQPCAAQRVVPVCDYVAESIALTIYTDKTGEAFVHLDSGSWNTSDGIAYTGTFYFTVLQPQPMGMRGVDERAADETDPPPPPPPPARSRAPHWLTRLAATVTRPLAALLALGAAPRLPTIRLDLVGSLGCSAQRYLLISIDSCAQTLFGSPDLCAWAKSYFGGAYQYSVQASPTGELSIIVPKWFNADSPFTLYSAVGATCDPYYNCSDASQVNLYTTLYGGTVNVSNSVVQILPDPSGNATIITVDGDSTDIESSVNVTFTAPNATSLNVTVYNSTFVVEAKPDTVELNIYSFNSTACAHAADWHAVTPTGNQSVARDAPAALYLGGPGGGLDALADWALIGADAIRYVGSVSPASISLEWCTVSARAYTANAAGTDQRLELRLYNVTTPLAPLTVDPLAVAISTLSPPHNDTLNSACASVIKELRTGDTFALYASAAGADVPAGGILLANESIFSLVALPVGCLAGSPSSNVTVNVTFNITVQFANDSGVLEVRKCLEKSTTFSNGTFTLTNTGVCGLEPREEAFPDVCWHFETSDPDTGQEELFFSGVCSVDANGGTPRGGSLSLVDSPTVAFTNTGQNFTAASRLTFVAGSCLATSTAGAQTNYTNTGLCSANANGGVARSGAIRFVDSATIGWINDDQDFIANSRYEFVAGGCLATTTDSGTSRVNYTNTGVCGVSANGDIARTGALDLQDSATVHFSNTGNTFTAHSALVFGAQRCLEVAQTGASVNYTNTGICTAASTNAVLSANLDLLTGHLELGYTGVESIRVTSSGTFRGGEITLLNAPDGKLTWSETSPGQFQPLIGGGTSACLSCNDTSRQSSLPANYTLTVNKVCAKEQCEVRSDSPVTEPGTRFWFIPCIFCFGGDDDDDGGGGGDDDDGSSDGGGVIPPPFIPFGAFPPVIVVVAAVPGGTGGGSGGSGGTSPPPGSPPPPAPLPIVITVPLGDPEPLTVGGTFLPATNFSMAPVYCGNSTHRAIVVDNSTLPELMYICMRTLNGTYAWVPHCPCSAAEGNTTIWYYGTSVLYQQGATLYVSNTSQVIVAGNTFLANTTVSGTLSATDVLINGTLEYCPANTSSRMRVSSIEPCSGTDTVTLHAGTLVMTIPDDPTPPECYMECFGTAAMSIGGQGGSPPIATITLNADVTVVGTLVSLVDPGLAIRMPEGIQQCPLPQAARPDFASFFGRLVGCDGAPLLVDAALNVTGGVTVAGNTYLVNVDINGALNACAVGMRTPSVSSCSGPLSLNGSSIVMTAGPVTFGLNASPGVPDGFYFANSAGTRLACSTAACQLTGNTRSSGWGCVGCSIDPSIAGDPPVVGDYVATRFFQGSTTQQVIDTVNCIGVTCTKANNTVTVDATTLQTTQIDATTLQTAQIQRSPCKAFATVNCVLTSFCNVTVADSSGFYCGGIDIVNMDSLVTDVKIFIPWTGMANTNNYVIKIDLQDGDTSFLPLPSPYSITKGTDYFAVLFKHTPAPRPFIAFWKFVWSIEQWTFV